MIAHKVAICVGHSRSGDNGASSGTGTSEWTFWNELAPRIQELVRAAGLGALVVNKYSGSDYGSAMSWLAGELKNQGATLAVELHFNDFDGSARGHEWLHWKGSKGGVKLASCLNTAFSKLFPDIPWRGIKSRTSSDRGALFLQRTHCPAVICEPFFGDNMRDWAIATSRLDDIAKSIANGIIDAATTIPAP